MIHRVSCLFARIGSSANKVSVGARGCVVDNDSAESGKRARRASELQKGIVGLSHPVFSHIRWDLFSLVNVTLALWQRMCCYDGGGEVEVR